MRNLPLKVRFFLILIFLTIFLSVPSVWGITIEEISQNYEMNYLDLGIPVAYQVNAIALSKDSGYVLAGYFKSMEKTPEGDYPLHDLSSEKSYSSLSGWIQKTDSRGIPEMDRKYQLGTRTEFNFLAPTRTDEWVIVGETNAGNPPGYSQGFLLRLDEQFREIGVHYYDYPGNTSFMQAIETYDGGYLLCGITRSNQYVPETHTWITPSDHTWVIKTDPSGREEWQSILDPAGHLFNLIQTPTGYMVVISFHPNDGRGSIVYTLDESGKVISTRDYRKSRSPTIRSLQPTIDGGYILGGWITANRTESPWLMKLDRSGNEQWNATLSDHPNDNEAYFVKQTQDSGYILVGISPLVELWVIKTDSGGREMWNEAFADGNYTLHSAFSRSDNQIIANGRDSGQFWIMKIDYGSGPAGRTLRGTQTSPEEQFSHVWGAARMKVQFASPGIGVTPARITFSSEDTNIDWETITFCIYNPPGYHVSNATIDLLIPEGYDFRVNTDPTSVFTFEPVYNRYTVSNFGNFAETSACDWFQVKKGSPKVLPLSNITLRYDIGYNHEAATLDGEQPEVSKTIFREESITLISVEKDKPLNQIIQENTWIFVIIGMMISLIGILFGPGSKGRVAWIKGIMKTPMKKK